MRREGWEARLEAALEAARARPYKLGVHDCFRVACQAVEALTGTDRWPEFAGKYSDERSARRLIAAHGRTFEAAFDWFFGAPSMPVWKARAGDIVAIQTPDGEKHLGVVMLDHVRAALLGPHGLVELPVSTCLCVWRVG